MDESPSPAACGPAGDLAARWDGKTDILVYHARNYEKIVGDPLKNPDRATRAQILHWKPDGTPDFGVPVADGPFR